MPLTKLSLLALTAAVLMTLPAFAGDTFTIFNNPGDGVYIPSTMNLGGGDGSGGVINGLGNINFSTGLLELSVPTSWATWNSPPFTESSTPNVLYTQGSTTLTLTLASGKFNTAGFELEPDLRQLEDVQVSFFNQNNQLIATIDRMVNGDGGALLFALQDDTLGSTISSIQITDEAEDDFAIAQLREGNSVPVPEPSMPLTLGTTGAIAAVGGLIRRKLGR